MKTLAKFEDAYHQHTFSGLVTLSLSFGRNLARLFKMPRKR